MFDIEKDAHFKSIAPTFREKGSINNEIIHLKVSTILCN